MPSYAESSANSLRLPVTPFLLRLASPTSDVTQWLAPFLARLGVRGDDEVPLDVAGLIGPGDRKSVEPMANKSMDAKFRLGSHFLSPLFWISSFPSSIEILLPVVSKQTTPPI